MTLEQQVGRKVRELRTAREWTQEDLARRMTRLGRQVGRRGSVYQSTIAKLESGERALRVNDLRGLADVFGVRPGALLDAQHNDDYTLAMNIFQERSARLLLMEDEVELAQTALRQAQDRREQWSQLVDDADAMLRLTHDADPEATEDDGEPGEAP